VGVSAAAHIEIETTAGTTSSTSKFPEHPRPDPVRLGQPIHSPSEGNAAAKQGYERCPSTACSLTPSACIPNHDFAIFLNPAQCTALNTKA
jgi:hypothetical protein